MVAFQETLCDVGTELAAHSSLTDRPATLKERKERNVDPVRSTRQERAVTTESGQIQLRQSFSLLLQALLDLQPVHLATKLTTALKEVTYGRFSHLQRPSGHVIKIWAPGNYFRTFATSPGDVVYVRDFPGQF